MSSYGTAFVLDTPLGVEPEVPEAVRSAVVDGFRTTAGAGTNRVAVLLSEVGLVDDVVEMLRAAGDGRVAIAEDDDEYGALWLVASARDGEVRIVHRRHVLNADPADPAAVALADFDADPREHDVAGRGAAVAAAAVFGVPSAGVVAAEQRSADAWREIGVVGGPFPWRDSLQLPWPVPAAGEPLGW